jgi:16S rRNA (cytosine967-C5)-methyltransferase
MSSRLATIPWASVASLAPILEPALAEVLAGAPAERVIDRTLRAHRDFSAVARQLTSESLFGVGLWRRRLRARLGQPDAPPLALLATLIADLGAAPDVAATLGPQLPLHEMPDWRDRVSMPDWLTSLLEARFGPDAERAAEAFNLPGPVCLRANRLRTTRDALAETLRAHGLQSHPGRLAPDALLLDTPRPNLFGLPPELHGHFEVQDEGSQLLGYLLGAQPGDTVLDLCAGAGGKSLQLAACVGPTGKVHAYDIDRPRLERLRTRSERAGARVTLHFMPLPASLQVPRILIDAPCSEVGALRRGPDLRWRLDASKFDDFPPLQRSLIDTAVQHLTPGGQLVYATCTVRPEENDAVVEAALRAHPRLRQVQRVELWPHEAGTDGFFASVLALSEATG